MTNAPARRSLRRIAGSILVYLVCILLVGSAVVKFARVPPVVAQLGVLGFEGGRLTLVAFLEIVSAVLFMLPRTRSLGLLVVSSYLGGAVAAHIGHGQSAALEPAILLGFLWLGAWLLHPAILWSFTRQN